MLVYSISFEHNQSHKLILADDLTLEKVFSEEPKETQALKVSLISAQMICKSLLGNLIEQDDGIVRSYEAKFIANSNDAHPKLFREIQGQHSVQDQVRNPLINEKTKSICLDQLSQDEFQVVEASNSNYSFPSISKFQFPSSDHG